MIQNMKKPLMAVMLSLTLGLTAASVPATPARATDAGDVAGVLAGLAALYIIGRAIEDHNDNRGRVVTRNVTPHRPQHQALVAPARCFREFWTSQGYVRGYLARCMQRNVQRAGSLPPQCIVRVHTDRGFRNLYRGRCLARNGWQREAGFRP